MTCLASWEGANMATWPSEPKRCLLFSFFLGFKIFFKYFLQLYCANGISPMGNRVASPGETSCNSVALPKLWCMLGVLVSP